MSQPDHRKCTRCGKLKLITAFWKKKKGTYGRESRCKECLKKEAKARYFSYTKGLHLRLKYGIVMDDYNKMFAGQGGCCVICGRHQSELKKSLAVDHDHGTGKVRSLLCIQCNGLLGLARDNVEILKAAISYLKKHKSIV